MAQDTDLGQQIAKGATWMVLQRMAVRGIGLLSTVILARLLIPEDFGLVALATGLIVVIDCLLEMGFETALIQQQTDDKTQYNTAWTLSVIRGAVMGAALLLAARPLAHLYDDPRLIQIVAWLAVSTIISGFQNIGCIEFRRELQFDREFTLLVWSKVISFLVTLILALTWGDYRALVAGIVVGKAVTVNMSYIMHPYRPSLSLKGYKSFLHFSKWLGANNISVVVHQRLDTFVIGKILGTGPLGFYTVAYEISNLATTELIWPITRVLFPGFAKIAGDRPRLARGFLDSISALAFLAIPLGVGIALTAPHIVGIFLGEKWTVVVPLIQILTLYGLINLPTANSSSLYLAIGRPDVLVKRSFPSVLALVPGLIFGAMKFGSVGTAWALVLAACVNFVMNFHFIRRELGVGIPEALQACKRPALAAFVMFVVVAALEHIWPTETQIVPLILQAGVISIVGASTYFAVALGLWIWAGRPQSAEQKAVLIVKSWIDARLSKDATQSSARPI